MFKSLKTQNFKILTISPGAVAAIHVAGVRGGPCGAVRWTPSRVNTLLFSRIQSTAKSLAVSLRLARGQFW